MKDNFDKGPLTEAVYYILLSLYTPLHGCKHQTAAAKLLHILRGNNQPAGQGLDYRLGGGRGQPKKKIFNNRKRKACSRKRA